MRCYKIFDVGVNAEGATVPKTLFHGLSVDGRRTRSIPIGWWMGAQRRSVTDGSRQTPYTSGFHCYATEADVREWFRRARNLHNRVVVAVEIRGVRMKPRACRPTILADWMLVSEEAWLRRETAQDFIWRYDRGLS